MTRAPEDAGVYVFLFDLPISVTVRVGALGPASFPTERYAYVGSARRGLAARLARHTRRRKPRRWHLDYLSRVAVPVGAIAWSWRCRRECRLAEALAATGLGHQAIPRFGASDCGCAGHLFVLSERAPESVAKRLAQRIRAKPIAVWQYR